MTTSAEIFSSSKTMSPDPSPSDRRLVTGDEILGRYVVCGEIGRGGMGIVYHCMDKTGGVDVAVKCLPTVVARNSDEMEDVRRNYQIVQGLVHENIASLKTLEKDEQGDYYVVMELAHGVNLKKWAMRYAGTEKISEKIAILRQIAKALDYAHSAKPKYVIHRDIKPENIMVDDDGRVKVLDFGLAAQVQSSLSHVSMMVTSRSGTAAYKSPEQWKARPQTASADQYSLGAVAYCLFAGIPPFDSEDMDILKDAVLHESIPNIDGLPKPAFRALQRALAKEPQDRFESCERFVDALEGKLTGRQEPQERIAWTKAAVGAVVVAAIAVGAYFVFTSRHEESLVASPAALETVPVQTTEVTNHQSTTDTSPAVQQVENATSVTDDASAETNAPSAETVTEVTSDVDVKAEEMLAADTAWKECTDAWSKADSKHATDDAGLFKAAYDHWTEATNAYARGTYSQAQTSFKLARDIYRKLALLPATVTNPEPQVQCRFCGGKGVRQIKCTCQSCYLTYVRNTGKILFQHGHVCNRCNSLGYEIGAQWPFDGGARKKCADCDGNGFCHCEDCGGSGMRQEPCTCRSLDEDDDGETE